MTERKNKGLYVHVPFCKKKCSYCDFFSVTNFEDKIDLYIDAVSLEATQYKDTEIDTLYIGGGTPSLLGPKISKLIRGLKNIFNFILDEATVEVNPESATKEFLIAAKDSGINRISIGIQSLSDSELESVGRLHTSNQALETIRLAKVVGFERISVDVMIGLPGQTKVSLNQTLVELMNQDIGQISAYCLSVEEGTPLSKHIPSTLPTTDEQVDFYFFMRELLLKNGYKHAEISNFSKPGEEPIHNLNCWRGHDYIGLGAGASSFVEGVRFRNKRDLEAYINSPTSQKLIEEELSERERAFDLIMLSLRMLDEGLDFGKLENQFPRSVTNQIKEIVEMLVTKKMLTESDGVYKICEHMILKSNIIFQEFII